MLMSSPQKVDAVESTDILGRPTEHISKLTNSWMLFWQAFLKSVRLEGESMTDAVARASMLWAAMNSAEKEEWEVKAAENRKTLLGQIRFVPPMTMNHRVRTSILSEYNSANGLQGNSKVFFLNSDFKF